MSNIKTVWAKPLSTTKDATKPRKPHRPAISVNIDSLVIDDTPMPRNVQRSHISKYDELFAKLKVGQNIKCQPHETPKVSNAMRSYFSRKSKNAVVRSIAHGEDGHGHVWLVRADPQTKRQAA